MILSKTDFLLYRIHFVEYLAWLIFKNKIDPLETLDEEDLRFVIRRENLAAPKRIPWESKDAYRQKLLQVNVPLFPPSLPPWRSFFPSFFQGPFFPPFPLFSGVLFSLVASLSLSHPGCTTRNTWWRRSMRTSSTLSASLTRRTCAYVLGGTESPCRSGGGSPRSCTGINSSRCPRLHNRSCHLLAIFFLAQTIDITHQNTNPVVACSKS